MARFRYRLQNVLNIKEKMEDQAKQEFSTARMLLDDEEEKLMSLKQKKIHL
jgi:flagellar FliJ protein